MVEIIYLEDETGTKQVIDEITRIVDAAHHNQGYANLAKYILQGLNYLEDVGVPKDKRIPAVLKADDGRLFTFHILKELKHHPPLLEFRINWKGEGYFRAIFFCIEEDDKQTLYFTKALVKQEPNPPEFNQKILESEQMLREFNLKGE